MTDPLRQAMTDPGPHTAESLAERLPDFPAAVIREALELLAAQGVLERVVRDDGQIEYRYVAPERYAQASLDVVKDPGPKFSQKPR